MNHPQDTRTRSGRARSVRRLLATGAVVATLPFLAAATVSTVAGASTLNGIATIATPGTLAPLTSGGSATQFTVTLPAGAACTGDTASGNYHVFSYFVDPSVTITSLNFATQQPSAGFGLVDGSGAYYGPANTAITTGQVVQIPQNFQWAPVVTTDSVYTPAQLAAQPYWNTGIACANASGAVTDYWNAQVVFTATSSDSNGFIWAVGPSTGAPEVPFTIILPVIAAVVIGGAVWLRRRPQTHRPADTTAV